MEQIIQYVTQYGLPVFIIASCIIALIGILKLCKVFAKIQTRGVEKLVYYILDIILSFAGAAIYYAIFTLDWTTYVAFCGTQICATTTLYAIYENFGVRKLFEIFRTWLAKVFAQNKNNKFVKLVQDIGLEDALAEIQKIINSAALEKAKTQNDEQKGS